MACPSKPATTQCPSKPATTQCPSTPATTQCPSTPATTQCPSTPATTQCPSSPACNQTPTTTYTISYNANGGSGAPASQTKTYNVTLTLSGTKPTRTGYNFQGWATSSTATSASYQPGGSYTSNAPVTLYAVWKAATYTVSYNANGGAGAPASQTKTYNVSLTLSGTKPTRSGYDFLGWATGSTTSSASYQPGGSYTANASVTLYAVWKAATYTVSYNANGGSGVPVSQTKTYNVALTLSGSKPTRSGYDFLGWSACSTAPSASYQPGGSYTANAPVTLYAVWKATVIPVTGVSIANGGGSLNIGQTRTLTANVLPCYATNKGVTWSSSNTSVATVNCVGVVYAVEKGEAVISVKTNDGGKTASCTIKATEILVTGIEIVLA